MKKMRMFTALLCSAAMTAMMGFTSFAENEGNQLQPVAMDGAVESVGENQFTMNWDRDGGSEPVIITVTDSTRVLDAVNGYPTALDSLKEGERVRVYAGPAMTLSLPPMTNAEMVLTDIPEDFRIPSFETVSSLVENQDGSHTVTTAAGNSYRVDQSTILLPYLTRNMVFVENLQSGVRFLVWTSEGENAAKIVIFPGESGSYGQEDSSVDTVGRHGWTETQDGWYYYETGELKKGWLLDGGDWYYLNQETGLMATGFVTVDGKTYFMEQDGRMLKEARVFTPDENGVLH